MFCLYEIMLCLEQEIFHLNSTPLAVSASVAASAENNMKLIFIMDSIFDATVVAKVESVCHVHSPSASSDVDGVEAIALYTALHTVMWEEVASLSSVSAENNAYYSFLSTASVSGLGSAANKGKSAGIQFSPVPCYLHSYYLLL